jgi:hypothetical protein
MVPIRQSSIAEKNSQMRLLQLDQTGRSPKAVNNVPVHCDWHDGGFRPG